MAKLAIVTGAGQGIGEGVAHRLAKDGFAIAVVDINADTGKKVTENLLRPGIPPSSIMSTWPIAKAFLIWSIQQLKTSVN